MALEGSMQSARTAFSGATSHAAAVGGGSASGGGAGGGGGGGGMDAFVSRAPAPPCAPLPLAPVGAASAAAAAAAAPLLPPAAGPVRSGTPAPPAAAGARVATAVEADGEDDDAAFLAACMSAVARVEGAWQGGGAGALRGP